MAKIQAGILSNVRGAVAGVVGGVWKGKNYVRARVTPANPNTLPQQEQRSKMRKCVAFGKLILGSVLIPFVNPYQKYMSGMNWFVKSNIALFGDTTGYSQIKLSEGTLFGLGEPLKDTDGTNISISWDPSQTGSNGAGTDLVTGVVVVKATGAVFTSGASALRSSGTLLIPVGSIMPAANVEVYAVVSKVVAGKLLAVSNSQYISAT